jgi:uncharacterized protein
MSLGNEKYLLLTTFKRDGSAVASPVWAVDLGEGRIGFWTSSGSGKAKRLAHTSRVTVQPCDARGRPRAGTAVTDADAVLVTGDKLETIRRLVKSKYGVMTTVTKLLAKIGGVLKRKQLPYGDQGVVITQRNVSA